MQTTHQSFRITSNALWRPCAWIAMAPHPPQGALLHLVHGRAQTAHYLQEMQQVLD